MAFNNETLVWLRRRAAKRPGGSSYFDNPGFGCNIAITYRKKNLDLGTEVVSVGSGNFTIFHEVVGTDFVCFRTSKISSYFRELNEIDVDVYNSSGRFAALRHYPCLRVQSSTEHHTRTRVTCPSHHWKSVPCRLISWVAQLITKVTVKISHTYINLKRLLI